MMSQKYIYPSLFQEEDPHESIPSEKTEYDLTNLFERLAKSDFRSRDLELLFITRIHGSPPVFSAPAPRCFPAARH